MTAAVVTKSFNTVLRNIRIDHVEVREGVSIDTTNRRGGVAIDTTNSVRGVAIDTTSSNTQDSNSDRYY